MEGVQPLDRSEGDTRRPKLPRKKLLLVAAVQGLGLLLALTCISLHFYAPQVQYPPAIQSIGVQLTRCEKDRFSLVKPPNEAETMEVQNNSIIIQCDGFYLVSLKGHFFQNVSLRLHYRKTKDPISILSTGNKVDFTTVVFLGYKDIVYLGLNRQKTCEDIQVNEGELILILQNPGGYCAP